jgi:site-specific DNA recombinase
MPPRREHPAKGWGAILDRSSMVRADIRQDTHYNQDRLNHETLRAYGLKLKPGYRFSETGVSASKPVTRKDLERGINAIVNEKAVEALVVQDVSRLSRLGMRHVGEMLDAVEAVGGRIIFHRGNLDSSQPHNRAIIAFLAEQAREEANTLSWRIGNFHEGARLKGRWANKRPYGYHVSDGKLVPHSEEAPIIRRIMEEFLDGKGFYSIAAGLNDDSVLSPAASKAVEARAKGRNPKNRIDAPWSGPVAAKILHSPTCVGWQQHNGKIVLGPDGDPISFGEGILTPGEHARVLAEFERRSAIVRNQQSEKRKVGSKTGGGRPARYLLVGLARCSSCDYALQAQSAHGYRSPYYRCSTTALGRPCPARATVNMEEADEEVLNQLRNRLELEPDDPILSAIAERWREVMMPEGEGERAVLQSRLDAVRGRIVDLDEARYLRSEFTTPDDIARWERMMERLKLQRDAVVDEVEALGPPPDFNLDALRATYRHEVWDSTPMAQRRKWLQVAVARVVIGPSHGGKISAADRVRVILVGEEDEA